MSRVEKSPCSRWPGGHKPRRVHDARVANGIVLVDLECACGAIGEVELDTADVVAHEPPEWGEVPSPEWEGPALRGVQDVLRGALPIVPDLDCCPLAEEIAFRVVANVKLVAAGFGGHKAVDYLYNQVLLVLADYRNHTWARGTLHGEGARITLAGRVMEAILACWRPTP